MVSSSDAQSGSTTPASPVASPSVSSATTTPCADEGAPSTFPSPPSRPLPPPRTASLLEASAGTAKLGEAPGRLSSPSDFAPSEEESLSPAIGEPSTSRRADQYGDEFEVADRVEEVEDAETPTHATGGAQMWPEECEEDEESCAATPGVWQAPATRARMRHMDVDEDDYSDQDSSDQEHGQRTGDSEDENSEEEGEEGEEESEEGDSEGHDDDDIQEDEASERHVAIPASPGQMEDEDEGEDVSEGPGIRSGEVIQTGRRGRKWGVQVEIPDGNYFASSSNPSTRGSSTPASDSRSPPANAGGQKKKKKKKKKSGTLEVGQDNMILMAQRVRELEDDNAELEELLDLLPAVKDWERKLERKASALRQRLKRVQARPLVPLSSLHLRTDGQSAPIMPLLESGEWARDGNLAVTHGPHAPEVGAGVGRGHSVGGGDNPEHDSGEHDGRVRGDGGDESLPLQWLAEQNLKMRGEIVNLEETKVRAIRKTVAMRMQLAAYDAALREAGVTQKTRHLLGLDIDKALGRAGDAAELGGTGHADGDEQTQGAASATSSAMASPASARTCSLAAMSPLAAGAASPLTQRVGEKMDEISGRIQQLTGSMMPPAALAALNKWPGAARWGGFALPRPPAADAAASAARSLAAKQAVEEALQALRAAVVQDTHLETGGGGDALYKAAPLHSAAKNEARTSSSAPHALRGNGAQVGGGGGAGLAGGGMEGSPRKVLGIPALLTSLEAVMAKPLAAAPLAVHKASEALEQLQLLVSQSSAARRAMGSCGGLRTLVAVSKLALTLEPRRAARGAAGGCAAGGGGGQGKRLHTDLSLRALAVMSEAAAASAALQHDLGAVGCVQVCVSYLDAALLAQAQGEEAQGLESQEAAAEAAALCEASLGLLCAVCKNNVMNQRSMLLAGMLRRLVALLRSPSAPIQQAAAATIHTAGCPTGRDHKLFQDELHRCQGVPALVRLLRLTGCLDAKRHVLQALVFACGGTHGKNQVALRTCGGIKALLELLRSAPPDLQQLAVATLDAAQHEQPESWLLLVQAGGADLLCRLLYTTPAVMQEALVRLLLHGCVQAGRESGLLAALHRADCRAALAATRQALATLKVASGPASVDALLLELDRIADIAA